MAVLERMGIATGIDLWALQDVADEVVRGEMMQRPIVIDRLTATMGYAAVPASYLLHAIRAGERFGLDPREIIVELGRRKVVVGQEDVIIGIAAELAAETHRGDHRLSSTTTPPARRRWPASRWCSTGRTARGAGGPLHRRPGGARAHELARSTTARGRGGWSRRRPRRAARRYPRARRRAAR